MHDNVLTHKETTAGEEEKRRGQTKIAKRGYEQQMYTSSLFHLDMENDMLLNATLTLVCQTFSISWHLLKEIIHFKAIQILKDKTNGLLLKGICLNT